MYIYDNISLSFLRMGNVSEKIIEKIKTHNLYSITFIPCSLPVYERMWKNVDPDRQRATV